MYLKVHMKHIYKKISGICIKLNWKMCELTKWVVDGVAKMKSASGGMKMFTAVKFYKWRMESYPPLPPLSLVQLPPRTTHYHDELPPVGSPENPRAGLAACATTAFI